MPIGPSRPSDAADDRQVGQPSRRAWPPALMTPVLAAFLTVLVALPLIELLWLTLSRGLFPEPLLLLALANSLLVATLSALGASAVAVPLAWLTETTDIAGGAVIRQALLAALLLPPFGFGLALPMLGVQLGPLTQLVLVLGLAAVGPVYLAAVLALRHHGADEQASARLLGVTHSARARLLRRATFPAVVGCFLLTVLRALSELAAPLLITAPVRTPILTTEFFLSFRQAPYGRDTAALALALCVLSIALLITVERVARASPGAGHGVQDAREAAPAFALRYWRLPLGVVVLGLLGAGLVAPVLALARAAVPALSRANWIDAAITTSSIAFLSALMALVLIVPVLLLARQRRDVAARLMQLACLLPAAVPALAFALGLFALAGGRGAGTLLLVAALAALSLPSALHHVRSGFDAIGRDQEDAARMLGVDARATWLRIMWPQLKPRVIGAFGLVFAACCRETSASLILAPSGAQPLAVESVTRATAGRSDEAAALLLLTMLLAALALFIARRASGAPLLLQAP